MILDDLVWIYLVLFSFFLVVGGNAPVANESSLAGHQIKATAVTCATAVAMPGPYPMCRAGGQTCTTAETTPDP